MAINWMKRPASVCTPTLQSAQWTVTTLRLLDTQIKGKKIICTCKRKILAWCPGGFEPFNREGVCKCVKRAKPSNLMGELQKETECPEGATQSKDGCTCEEVGDRQCQERAYLSDNYCKCTLTNAPTCQNNNISKKCQFDKNRCECA